MRPLSATVPKGWPPAGACSILAAVATRGSRGGQRADEGDVQRRCRFAGGRPHPSLGTHGQMLEQAQGGLWLRAGGPQEGLDELAGQQLGPGTAAIGGQASAGDAVGNRPGEQAAVGQAEQGPGPPAGGRPGGGVGAARHRYICYNNYTTLSTISTRPAAPGSRCTPRSAARPGTPGTPSRSRRC